MQSIFYNRIPWLLNGPGNPQNGPARSLHFTAGVQAFRVWKPTIMHAKNSPKEQRRLPTKLLADFASKLNLNRPDRREPITAKRKSVSY